ncbi:hypothetical protein DFP72DRAFT_892559 [Ephemerocybe angulata]|uniref:F-box domain-containing protein n=1 Tax=Ephemerocybe angulata TaxID=980116 RepID=A0A8H6M9C5_9AGAR|nr:hypothetical protein DFP72DRAFT_892559 [Tulosesus angulatus]
MITLPPELRTVVITCLRASDIVHLQQTCKDFNSLIEGSAEIWKACLKNQCHNEGLFWSTYNGLSTALEYKNACIGIWRFKEFCQNGDDMADLAKARYLPVKAYGDLAEEGDAKEYGMVEPVFDKHFKKNPHPGISSTYLVPGGRFLVTVDRTWLLLWDLGPPGGQVKKPVVLSSHKFHCSSSITMLDVYIVDEHDALRIILQEYDFEEIPPYISENQGQGLPLGGSRFCVFHRFEISLPESGEYTIKPLGRLCVARTDIDDIFAAQSENQVALEISPGNVLLWNLNTLQPDGAFSFWESPECSSFYMQQGYLFIITGKGVQATNLSQFSWSPVKNGLVDLETLSPEKPSITYTFTHPVELPGRADYVILPRSIPSTGVVKYDIRADQYHTSAHRICQFSFDFHLEEPSTSALHSLGTPHYGSRPTRAVHRFECAQGGWGYAWTSTTSDTRAVTVTLHEASGVTHSEACQDLEAIVKYPENPTILLEDVNVCPFSGRIVFLWDRRLVRDMMLEIVDYL